MNADEAASEAVQGARVTCDHIGEGVYVDYQFNGWRIHHRDGSSSGFSFHREPLQAAEWRIVPIEAPKPKPNVWGRQRIALGEAGVPPHNGMYPDAIAEAVTETARGFMQELQQQGRALRQPPNVGTAAPITGLALARLERAAAAEPLPEPVKPATPWGSAKAKPWGPGK